MWENQVLSLGFANNKGADQPAHLGSLISALVALLLESILSNLATSSISLFWLVSVAEETGLSVTLSETRRQVFSCQGPNGRIYLLYSLLTCWVILHAFCCLQIFLNQFLKKIFLECQTVLA